jgi:hypothetical protein
MKGVFMDSTFTRIERPVHDDRVAVAGHAFDSEMIGAEVELERRNGLRRPLRIKANLFPLGGADAISCTSDNIGEGGLHAVVPVGYGLAVGQRYELILGEPSRTTDDSGIMLLPGEGHYATVVRTELIMKEHGDQVGVGLRFDQPLVL